MLQMEIESDIAATQATLAELGIHIPNISKKILKRIASKGRAKLRKAYMTSGIETKTGALYKALFQSAKGNDLAYFGVASKQHYVFLPLNYGAEIQAKGGAYLTFQDASGGWHRVKSIHIKARNFFHAAEDYIGSQEYQADIDTVVGREVDKLFKLS